LGTLNILGKPNNLGIHLGWSWLAAMLNMSPRPITPVLLASFLEQASYALFRRYGKNFENIVRFILEKYLSLVPKSAIAAKTRLELIVCELLRVGLLNAKEPIGHFFSR